MLTRFAVKGWRTNIGGYSWGQLTEQLTGPRKLTKPLPHVEASCEMLLQMSLPLSPNAKWQSAVSAIS